MLFRHLLLLIGTFVTGWVNSQPLPALKKAIIFSDSSLVSVISAPEVYFQEVEHKIKKYTGQVNAKTVRTLEKLSRWEDKIKTLLLKTNPKAAERLFGNEQATFGFLLSKIKEGKTISGNYIARYDTYRDRLTASLKYLVEKRAFDTTLRLPLNTIEQIESLSKKENDNEFIREFIKERKKQLINETLQYVGRSKYLNKINRESYYYFEALRSYKEVFSNEKKTERAMLDALVKIPVFQKFMRQNSQLTGLFASPDAFPALSSGGSMPVINGLTPRKAVQQFIGESTHNDEHINIDSHIREKINNAYPTTVNKEYREKELRDFKPNSQRSKPFIKRLEPGIDFQFGKSTNYLPATANIGLKLAYKLDDRSNLGIGVSYMAGLGRGWTHFDFTNQGIGFRTYLNWKWRKGFGLQGGSEWNYMLQFKDFDQLKDMEAWQQSSLIGVNKMYSISKKIKGNVQLLYNVFHAKNRPQSQPLIVRFGYGF